MVRMSGDAKAKIMRYFARGISTAFTGLILLFAIGEGINSANPGEPFIWDFEHIKMIVFCLLIVAGTGSGWWRDRLGGIILTSAGVLMSLLLFIEMEYQDYWIIGIFGLPYILCGLLFLLSWARTRRTRAL